MCAATPIVGRSAATRIIGQSAGRQPCAGAAGSGNRVALINGGQVVSFTCAPVCEQVGGAGGAQPAAAPAPAGGAIEAPHASGSVSASPNSP